LALRVRSQPGLDDEFPEQLRLANAVASDQRVGSIDQRRLDAEAWLDHMRLRESR
jgi:hypothetical protein